MEQVDSIDLSRIRAFLKVNFNGSRAGYAEAAGLSKNALRDIEDPDWNPRLETLRSLNRTIPIGWNPPQDAA